MVRLALLLRYLRYLRHLCPYTARNFNKSQHLSSFAAILMVVVAIVHSEFTFLFLCFSPSQCAASFISLCISLTGLDSSSAWSLVSDRIFQSPSSRGAAPEQRSGHATCSALDAGALFLFGGSAEYQGIVSYMKDLWALDTSELSIYLSDDERRCEE